MLSQLQSELLDCMLLADRRRAGQLVDGWAAANGYERAVMELLEPVLDRFGQRWTKEGGVSLAQAYIAGRIAEDIMNKAAISLSEADRSPYYKGPFVIGNIEDDCHVLGRRLVTTFLRVAGWGVHDLGNDVPPAVFVDKALEIGARVIGASALMTSTAVNIKKLRNEIDRRGMNGVIQLAVGGAVFKLHPDLVEEVGGDGTAVNALQAPALVEQLWARAEVAEADR